MKMNVDTDTQYAFTRPIVSHMFANYDGVLKIDGEDGGVISIPLGNAEEAGHAGAPV